MRTDWKTCGESYCYINELLEGKNIIMRMFPQRLWPEVGDRGFRIWDLHVTWWDTLQRENHQQSRHRLVCQFHSDQIMIMWDESIERDILEYEATEEYCIRNGGRL